MSNDVMSLSAAEAMTQEISQALLHCGALILRAYEQRIWLSYGLSTWVAYCEKKLGVQERQAWNLLALARCTSALTAVAGEPVKVTHRQAAALLADNGAGLAAACATIGERLKEAHDATPEERSGVVDACLRKAAKRAQKATAKAPAKRAPASLADMAQTMAANDVAVGVPKDDLAAVTTWVSSLLKALDARLLRSMETDYSAAMPQPSKQRSSKRMGPMEVLRKEPSDHIGPGVDGEPAVERDLDAVATLTGWSVYSRSGQAQPGGAEYSVTYQWGSSLIIQPGQSIGRVRAVFHQPGGKGTSWLLAGGYEHNGEPLNAAEVRSILASPLGEAGACVIAPLTDEELDALL